MIEIVRCSDSKLDSQCESDLRVLLSDAFEGDFSEEDWQHTFGGLRFLGYKGLKLVAHGAIVPRQIKVNGQNLRVGYVEGLAVARTHWNERKGSSLMAEITSHCKSEYLISMLSTDRKSFYRRHGWLDFAGESYVLREGLEIRTEDEDDGLMYLRGKDESLKEPIRVVCETRSGDDW